MLSLGGAGSGLPWHLHGQTWIALTAGLKRWFVFPPDHLPGTAKARGHPLQMAAEWANRTYNSSTPTASVFSSSVSSSQATMLKECVQRPGELFYLPVAWEHLTLNLEATVAI
eukprot:SAG31_NODE_14699_length_792_cov_0.952381_1_plen_112_part_10